MYGVSASVVASRTREIGIRTALGASKREVMTLMLRSGLTPVLLGLVAGMLGASYVGRALAGMLFGITPGDPLSIVVVAVALISAALVASYIPARRAGRVDPVIALRSE